MSFICHFVIRRLLGLYEMNSTENLCVLTNYITKIIKKKARKAFGTSKFDWFPAFSRVVSDLETFLLIKFSLSMDLSSS